MHSISDGLIAMHLCGIYFYVLFSMHVSFHWPFWGNALCSPDNHLALHLMYGCDYVWDVCVIQHKFLSKTC